MAKALNAVKEIAKTTQESDRHILTPGLTLSEMTGETLTNEIRESVELCDRYTREWMAEVRSKLLPMWDEAVKRIKEGKGVNGCKTVKDLCEAVGVKDSTIRMWRMRAKDGTTAPQPRKGQTIKTVFAASKELIDKVNTIKTGLRYADRHTLAAELWTKGNTLLSLSKELSATQLEDVA